MAYALCPEEGLPRIWRFVPKGVLPNGVLCTLDPVQNVLVIDKDLYDNLVPFPDQHLVLRTHATKMYANGFSDRPTQLIGSIY